VPPQDLVEQLARELEERLGGNLVGVYLHGSLALGCFNPQRSDIDFLVVTSRRLDARERRSIAEFALSRSAAPYPLELTVLSEADARPWRYPTPYDFHYGESLRPRVEQQLAGDAIPEADDTDHDLAGHIGLLLARGRTLVGPPAEDVFPLVPEADFRDSILRDFAWIQKPETRMGGRIYGVLNACRVLAYLRGAGILSKAEAGEWAAHALPPKLRPTAKAALAAYRSGSEEPCPERTVRRFVEELAELIDRELRQREASGKRSRVRQ
jgi:predicted nucleotidyltransferase